MSNASQKKTTRGEGTNKDPVSKIFRHIAFQKAGERLGRQGGETRKQRATNWAKRKGGGGIKGKKHTLTFTRDLILETSLQDKKSHQKKAAASNVTKGEGLQGSRSDTPRQFNFSVLVKVGQKKEANRPKHESKPRGKWRDLKEKESCKISSPASNILPREIRGKRETLRQ